MGSGRHGFKHHRPVAILCCLLEGIGDPLMFDDTTAQDPTIRGRVILEVHVTEDGRWQARLIPDLLPDANKHPRDTYKLALLCADTQAHVNKTLEFIDTIIQTKEEVRKIHNELVEEKMTPGTKQVQTKLPFGERTG